PHRPRPSTRRPTGCPQMISPPPSSITSTSARTSSPDPPRGIVQLRRWRPNTIEYASGTDPGETRRPPAQKRLRVAPLNLWADHRQGARRGGPQPATRPGSAGQHLAERGPEADRVEAL